MLHFAFILVYGSSCDLIQAVCPVVKIFVTFHQISKMNKISGSYVLFKIYFKNIILKNTSQNVLHIPKILFHKIFPKNSFSKFQKIFFKIHL